MRTRRQFLAAGGQVAAALALGGGFVAGPAAARAAPIAATALGSGFTLLTGAGCNVVALSGPDGALLVDGGYAANSQALLRASSQATGKRRIATLINTHWHPAQTGSNDAVGREGGAIIAHEVTRLYLARPIASVDYDGLYGPLPPRARPTRTTRHEDAIDFARHHVAYGYLPAAHTNGDLYVHIPDADLLVTGGPVCSESWPVLDWRNGAWLGGLVRAHEKLASLARTGTRIVPANGRLLSADELKRQRDLFAAFHDRMVGFQNKGMDTGDILAERPLKDYEAQYGDPASFIVGAFRSLNLAYSPD